MGLFDSVEFEAPCLKCGTMLTDWQTKDGNPYLKTVKPQDVWVWYALCECGAFNIREWQKATDRPPIERVEV